VISRNDIQRWADRFLSALQRPPPTPSRYEQLTAVTIQ
jgi:hypothetical protein